MSIPIVSFGNFLSSLITDRQQFLLVARIENNRMSPLPIINRNDNTVFTGLIVVYQLVNNTGTNKGLVSQ